MCLERERRGRTKGGRRVVPDRVEQLVGAAQAALERRDQTALAIETMLDVLVELRGGSQTTGPCPGQRAVSESARSLRSDSR